MVALVKGPEVAGVTFSDSDSVPSPKFLNPDPAILQIWESDSCCWVRLASSTWSIL